jgi:hypothetical protein
MFFRPQKFVPTGATLVAADQERSALLDLHPRSALNALLGSLPTSEIDLLTVSLAKSYWERSDRFDLALGISAGERGMAALGRVITRWLSHLLAIDVAVEPLAEVRSDSFSWYLGLSADATRIGDAIWNGDDLDDVARAQLVGLFRLTFLDPSVVIDRVRDQPVYLLMAMTPDEVLRLKPQNLITGLPIRHAEAVN